MAGSSCSSEFVERTLGHRRLKEELLEEVRGVLYIRQVWSNSLASSTRRVRVIGGGKTPMIFWWRAVGMFWRKAYILVSLLAPNLLAWVDHSWYHSEKGLLPIFRVWRSWVDRSFWSTGIKWALKASWKSCQLPKSGGEFARAVCWRSFAHSPAEVPNLKWVSVEAIRLLVKEYRF
jgi:hypothetical protein